MRRSVYSVVLLVGAVTLGCDRPPVVPTGDVSTLVSDRGLGVPFAPMETEEISGDSRAAKGGGVDRFPTPTATPTPTVFLELKAEADTFVDPSGLYTAHSSDSELVTTSSGSAIILGFSTASIANALNGYTFRRVQLQLVIDNAVSDQGRASIDLRVHQVDRPWDERSASFRCPSSSAQDGTCGTENEWSSGTDGARFFKSDVEGTISIPASAQRQVVKIDLPKQAILDMLTGVQANNGWVIRSVTGSNGGTVRVPSRGTGYDPRLMFEVDDPNPPPPPFKFTQITDFSCPNSQLNDVSVTLGGYTYKSALVLGASPDDRIMSQAEGGEGSFRVTANGGSRVGTYIADNDPVARPAGLLVIGNISESEDIILEPGDCTITYDGGKTLRLNNIGRLIGPGVPGFSLTAFWITASGDVYPVGHKHGAASSADVWAYKYSTVWRNRL